jgi:hypothetical protein
MQNDLIKIKIRRHGNRYAGTTSFSWFEKTFAYIHASEVFDITDDYLTVERNQSIIRYHLDEPAEDIVDRINEKFNSKK